MLRRVVGVVLFLQIVGAVAADTPSYRPSPGSTPPVPKVRTAYEAETCAPFDRMIAMARTGREGPGKPLFGNVQNATVLEPLFQNHTCKAWSNSGGGYTVNCKMTSPDWQWPSQVRAYRSGTLAMCYPDWKRTNIAETMMFTGPDRKTRWSLSIPDPKYYEPTVETTVHYEPDEAQ